MINLLELARWRPIGCQNSLFLLNERFELSENLSDFSDAVHGRQEFLVRSRLQITLASGAKDQTFERSIHKGETQNATQNIAAAAHFRRLVQQRKTACDQDRQQTPHHAQDDPQVCPGGDQALNVAKIKPLVFLPKIGVLNAENMILAQPESVGERNRHAKRPFRSGQPTIFFFSQEILLEVNERNAGQLKRL